MRNDNGGHCVHYSQGGLSSATAHISFSTPCHDTEPTECYAAPPELNWRGEYREHLVRKEVGPDVLFRTSGVCI